MKYFWLFDTRASWKNNLPLTYFKPIANILSGILPVYRKWETDLDAKALVLTRDYLMEKYGGEGMADLWVAADVLPDAVLAKAVSELKPGEMLTDAEGDVVAYRHHSLLGTGEAKNLKAVFAGALIRKKAGGPVRRMRRPFQWIKENEQEIVNDLERLRPTRIPCPQDVRCYGHYELYGTGSPTAYDAVLDLTEGPVYLGNDVKLLPGSYVKGPAAVLDGSMVKAGTRVYNGTTLGPWTKVGGEIKNVLFQGYANKGHDGFLGDSFISQWCNLGAGTSNSNLKNNYSRIRMWHIASKQFEDTGEMFLGTVMGEHSKTAINTSLNTGTVVGVAANIFTRNFPPKFVTSFNWGGEIANHAYDVEKALETARIVFGRRGKTFDETEERIFRTVHRLAGEWE